jgi:hypothetical protein
VRGQRWCNDEALPVLFEFEDRHFDPHIFIGMGSDEFLSVRPAHRDRHKNTTRVLPVTEALANAKCPWVERIVALGVVVVYVKSIGEIVHSRLLY